MWTIFSGLKLGQDVPDTGEGGGGGDDKGQKKDKENYEDVDDLLRLPGCSVRLDGSPHAYYRVFWCDLFKKGFMISSDELGT